MPFAVLSAFFGMISSFLSAVSAMRNKKWLDLMYRSVFAVVSVFSFLAVIHNSESRRRISHQAA